MDKPDVDEIHGIAPAIAIRQKNSTRNPRSTVGTQTEIYDYLRLLFARVGQTYCRVCGRLVTRDSPDSIADEVLGNLAEGTRFYVLFPASAGLSEPNREASKKRSRGSNVAPVDNGAPDEPDATRLHASLLQRPNNRSAIAR